jgi:hypothetical protein
MADRRASERVVNDDSAALVHQDQRIVVDIVNLSLGGAQLQCPADWAPAVGAACLLEIVDQYHQRLQLDTEVVWSRKGSLGLRIAWLAPEQRYYLNRLLAGLAQRSGLGAVAVC